MLHLMISRRPEVSTSVTAQAGEYDCSGTGLSHLWKSYTERNSGHLNQSVIERREDKCEGQTYRPGVRVQCAELSSRAFILSNKTLPTQPANSLADNTCEILVPPTADPVIR